MRRYLRFLLLALPLLGLSCARPDSPELSGWRFARGDLEGAAALDYDDAAWEAVELPALLDIDADAPWFWLRGELAAPDSGPVYLLSGKTGAACEVYVDGELVGVRGIMPPDPYVRPGISDVFLVPERLLADGGARVALRCYGRGESAAIPVWKAGDRSAAEFDRQVVNFLNCQLYVILAVICLFLGVFFFGQFFSRPTDLASLWYALSLTLIAVYLYELGAERFIPDSLLFKAFAKTALSASIGFLMLFFASFFKLHDNRLLRVLVGLDTLVFLVLFVGASSAEARLMDIFTLSLLPIFAAVFFGVYLVGRAALRHSRDALPILLGLVVGVGFGIHDILYQIRGQEPLVWLQAFTFFGLDLSVFIAMSVRSARASTEVERFASEAIARRDRLGAVIEGAGRGVANAAGLARELETRAARLARAASAAVDEAKGIEALADDQGQAVGASGKAVVGLADSIEAVDSGLATELERLAEALGALRGIVEGASRVSTDIGAAADLAGGLALRVEEGVRDVASLTASIARVRDASREIATIIDTVDDFAERTNLLSMNASIEAAHAGAAGRGFSVIAHEIKQLAQASAERAARIREMAQGIETLVEQGSVIAEKVSKGLGGIAGDSGNAADRIAAVAAEARRQRDLADDARAELENFGESSKQMRDQTAHQAEYSRSVRESMFALDAGAQKVRGAGSRIASVTDELAEQASGLRELATRSAAMAAELEGVVAERSAGSGPAEPGQDLPDPATPDAHPLPA